MKPTLRTFLLCVLAIAGTGLSFLLVRQVARSANGDPSHRFEGAGSADAEVLRGLVARLIGRHSPST